MRTDAAVLQPTTFWWHLNLICSDLNCLLVLLPHSKLFGASFRYVRSISLATTVLGWWVNEQTLVFVCQTFMSVLSALLTCHFCLAGSDPAGRRDLLLPVTAHMSNGIPSPQEVQDWPDSLHDRVVYVYLLTHLTVGLCIACMGHVLLWRYHS